MSWTASLARRVPPPPPPPPRAGGAHGTWSLLGREGSSQGFGSLPPCQPPADLTLINGRGHGSQGFDSLPPGQPPADMTLTRASMLAPKPKPKPKLKPPTFTLKTRDVHKYSVGQHVSGVGKDGKMSGIIVKLERDFTDGRAGVMTVQPPTSARLSA